MSGRSLVKKIRQVTDGNDPILNGNSPYDLGAFFDSNPVQLDISGTSGLAMVNKYFLGFVPAIVMVGLLYFFANDGEKTTLSDNQDSKDARTSNSDRQTPISRVSVTPSEVDGMTLEQRRQFYRSISDNEPYVPIGTILTILDRGIVDPDPKVRLYALNRFVRSHYIYGAAEPSAIFNDDPERLAVFVNMLGDSDTYIREGSFRVLAENFSEREDVATALAEAVRVEDAKRLNMLRSFASVLRSHPQIASPVFIDEVTMWASTPERGTPVDAAFILSVFGSPPIEILEPVITMLENDYFGSPHLLDVLEKFGPLARPYLGRLKELQANVNDRIHNSRDDHGRGSSTFSKERYTSILQKIESAD